MEVQTWPASKDLPHRLTFNVVDTGPGIPAGPNLQTLLIYKLGFNQSYNMFTLILLIKIVLRSKFP